MKRLYAIVLSFVFTYGCVGAKIVPSKELITSVKQVQVVAMEAPPLDLHQSPPAGIGPLVPIQAAGGSIPAVRGIGVFNTLLIFTQLTADSYRSNDASRSYQTVLDTKGVWTPTVALADEVSKQLTACGIAAYVAPGVTPMPGVEFRGTTFLMENWLAPIRAHYNYTGPVQSYRSLASDQSIFVLEVSISNYEVSFGKLLVQMHLKLIDPRAEQVVGRVRSGNAFNTPSVKPLDQVLANDAARFKEIFSETGCKLVRQSLADLGFLPPSN